ncbi:MAG: flagellar basal-body rod protein FlgB [Acidobacteria bacterium]|nr:flagellar basal-body rod protein FlgB [Acidobacteriota bacterium]
MKAGLIQDPTAEAMGNFMTRLSRRQQVVASNIANIDTPGYKTKDVSFHLTMQEILSGDSLPLNTRKPEAGLLQGWAPIAMEPEVFETGGLPVRADHNNVDIDREMLKLSETSFTYAVATQLLRSKFRTISSAIQEGRAG